MGKPLVPTDLDRLEELGRLGCSDHGCRFRPAQRGGMGTNGGCRCLDEKSQVKQFRRLGELGRMVPALIAAHRQALARVERLEGALRKADHALQGMLYSDAPCVLDDAEDARKAIAAALLPLPTPNPPTSEADDE